MYDFIFAGSGVAAILLLDEIMRSPLRDSRILLIDRGSRTQNERTLSFWEEGSNHLDNIIYKNWETIGFATPEVLLERQLHSYRYKCIRWSDLHQHCFNIIKEHPNIQFVQEEVISVEDTGNVATVQTQNSSYQAKYVFDSRFEIAKLPTGKHVCLKQHFRGWYIHTDKQIFGAGKMHMLDFRIPQEKDFRFCYMLPFSDKDALIELVTLTPTAYDDILKQFISENLHIEDYEITGYEGGVNPLTDTPFPRRQGDHILKIGTAGGMIKPTSGYGFTRMQQDAQAIVKSLTVSGDPFSTPKQSRFHSFCDSLMLRVLNDNPQSGEKIFTAMFKRNRIESILRFLDEKASPWEIFKLMLTMYPFVFLRKIFSR